MDIRNWFSVSPKGSSKPSKQQTSSKDNSIKHKSPQKETKKSKRRVIDSDDSDEEFKKKKNKLSANGVKRSSPNKEGSVSKKQKIISDEEDCVIVDDYGSPVSRRSPRKHQSSNDAKKSSAAVLPKAVSVTDFFGNTPVQRISNKLAQKAKAAKAVVKVEDNHEDEDFCKTLSQLDEAAKKSKKQDKVKDVQKEKESLEKEIMSTYEGKPETKASPKKQITPKKEISPKKKISPKKERLPKEGKPKKASKRFSSDIEIVPPPPVEKKKIVVEETPPKKAPAKKGNAALYFSYLNRQGPTALGSKEIPEGEEECLKGKTFVITGVLESIERDDAKQLIEKYGGKVMVTLSKNTNFIVIGRDAGTSKLDKAVKLGTTQLDEDGLFNLIRTSPGTGPKKKAPAVSEPPPVAESPEKQTAADISKKFEQFVCKTSQTKPNVSIPDRIDEGKKSEMSFASMESDPSGATVPTSFEMWVDKYKPLSLKKVIGQQGPSSNANKLLTWLGSWHKHALNKKAASAGRYNANNNGFGLKAALLSGPPGVGKTTTAQLVCKELGFDFCELNASDTRSKKHLQGIVSEMLLNKSLSSCFKGDVKGSLTNNHAVIMDEVDGMAGNEDRGGIQELINFIKTSKIPIICICNDRNHPKIRSLSNYCFDLRFQKPRVEQIKASMLSIAYKEGVQLTPNVLNEVIVASNQDIRQVLHNLSVWCAKSNGLSQEQVKKDIANGTKHVKMSPFDVLREVFLIGNNKNASLSDKADLFFHDYSIAPLFVQENYVHVLPTAAGNDRKKHLQLLSEAADSICEGDVVDKQIRSRSSWGLLPVQAIFASVIPGELLTGHLRQMINFPAWLGKNSNRNYMNRILQELQMHMRMRITGDKTDVALDYLPLLKRALTHPLLSKETDGIIDVLRVMNSYYLLREDFDSVIELSLWSHQKDPRSSISAKVKSAFTRAYNKQSRPNPYAAPSASKKKKKGGPSYSEELPGEEGADDYESEEEEDSEEDLTKNSEIKVKKQTGKKSSEKGAELASSSKAAGKKGRPRK